MSGLGTIANTKQECSKQIVLHMDRNKLRTPQKQNYPLVLKYQPAASLISFRKWQLLSTIISIQGIRDDRKRTATCYCYQTNAQILFTVLGLLQLGHRGQHDCYQAHSSH